MIRNSSVRGDINFQKLFESSPGLYLTLLPEDDFTIVAASDAYLNATMTKRKEILGRHLFDIFPDNPNDPEADGVSNLRASLNSVRHNKIPHAMAIQKYDIRKPDGKFEVRFWSPLNTPVLNTDGEIEFIIHRVEDATEFMRLKQAQAKSDKITEGLMERVEEMELEIYQRAQEIQKMNAELEKKIEERTKEIIKMNLELEQKVADRTADLEAFTYSVSHDLRAPLRAVDGFANMLHEDYGDKLDREANRLLGVIQYNAKKMGTLIDDLLTFSKLGKKELQKKEINMQMLLKEVITESEIKFSGKAEIKTGLIFPAQGDYVLIKQVLMNLVSNALKYSSKTNKPVIEITSQQEKGKAVYAVKDNGVGFDMQYAPKLFGVFQRLHRIEDFEGTGVGLAVVHRIINRHGGRVWAEAEIGKGATFYFSLPLNQKQEQYENQ